MADSEDKLSDCLAQHEAVMQQREATREALRDKKKKVCKKKKSSKVNMPPAVLRTDSNFSFLFLFPFVMRSVKMASIAKKVLLHEKEEKALEKKHNEERGKRTKLQCSRETKDKALHENQIRIDKKRKVRPRLEGHSKERRVNKNKAEASG